MITGPGLSAAAPTRLRWAGRLRWLARGWTLLLVLALGVVALTGGIPRDVHSDGMLHTLEQPIQFALLAVAALALLLSWWFEAVAAVLLLLVGIGLGALSLSLHPPVFAVAVPVAFLLPAAAFWAVWRSGRPRRAVVVHAVVVVVALAMGVTGVSVAYDRMFGPTHPASTAADEPVDRVDWIWSGGVTNTSFRVTARIDDDDAAQATLVVEHGEAASSDQAAPPAPVDAVGPTPVPDSGVVTWDVDDLESDSPYQYTVIVDDHADETRGQGTVRTFPDGPASFTVTIGACARTGSNGAVFDAIRATDPLLYINDGDLHYGNIPGDDVDMFRARYADVLTSPAQSALYRTVPTAYIWDDHDYGANNSGATSPSRAAARFAYRENVPHYELPAGEGDEAIYQAFTAGRVRFIVTDGRSERTGESMLGERQLAWFERELRTAAEENAVIVWVNAVPWISSGGAHADDWSRYPEERRHIAGLIERAGTGKVVMLSGDAHMLAIDDGTNSGYGPSGAGFPVLHAAALDRGGSTKGGPYSHGTRPGGGQFGTLTVDDDGTGPITVTLAGLNWTGEELMSYEFTVPTPTP